MAKGRKEYEASLSDVERSLILEAAILISSDLSGPDANSMKVVITPERTVNVFGSTEVIGLVKEKLEMLRREPRTGTRLEQYGGRLG